MQMTVLFPGQQRTRSTRPRQCPTGVQRPPIKIQVCEDHVREWTVPLWSHHCVLLFCPLFDLALLDELVQVDPLDPDGSSTFPEPIVAEFAGFTQTVNNRGRNVEVFRRLLHRQELSLREGGYRFTISGHGVALLLNVVRYLPHSVRPKVSCPSPRKGRPSVPKSGTVGRQ